jgi:hypothetical protein
VGRIDLANNFAITPLQSHPSEIRRSEVCAAEGRALVTLDRDFGEVLRFPPEKSAGIIILDIGPRTTVQGIIDRLRDFLAVVEITPVAGALWIVEPGRVRIHVQGHDDS